MMLQLLEYNTWRYKLVFKSIEINSGKSLDFIADDIGLYFKSINHHGVRLIRIYFYGRTIFNIQQHSTIKTVMYF